MTSKVHTSVRPLRESYLDQNEDTTATEFKSDRHIGQLQWHANAFLYLFLLRLPEKRTLS